LANQGNSIHFFRKTKLIGKFCRSQAVSNPNKKQRKDIFHMQRQACLIHFNFNQQIVFFPLTSEAKGTAMIPLKSAIDSARFQNQKK